LLELSFLSLSSNFVENFEIESSLGMLLDVGMSPIDIPGKSPLSLYFASTLDRIRGRRSTVSTIFIDMHGVPTIFKIKGLELRI
jgi:hypothetical protein